MKNNIRIKILLLGILVSTYLGGCAPATTTTEGPPPPDGEAVVNYITNINPYQSWALWPGKGKLYEGQHPHGAFLTTYVSNGAVQAITQNTGHIPAREFIVKENYTTDKQLAAVTVMYRVPGYNPQAGDWFWLKYDPNGLIQKEGKVTGCIDCHRSVKSNDWLFTGPVM